MYTNRKERNLSAIMHFLEKSLEREILSLCACLHDVAANVRGFTRPCFLVSLIELEHFPCDVQLNVQLVSVVVKFRFNSFGRVSGNG